MSPVFLPSWWITIDNKRTAISIITEAAAHALVMRFVGNDCNDTGHVWSVGGAPSDVTLDAQTLELDYQIARDAEALC